jgi:hypothetical protein
MAKFDNITAVVDWLVSEDNDGCQEAAELIRDLVVLHVDTANEVDGYDQYDDTLGLALPEILDLVGNDDEDDE